MARVRALVQSVVTACANGSVTEPILVARHRCRRRPPIARYKDAVFYQLHVKTFSDSNGDGIGDFPGLTARLDYLAALGVDCLWLLPMYPSPFRTTATTSPTTTSIHPSTARSTTSGFLAGAHARGLRVITELVLNHTSDQHPWFQEARSSRDNPRRDWYVWSDTDDRYPRRAHHLPRHRAVELGLGPGLEAGTTGTASSAISPTSTTTTRPCAKRCGR